MVVYEQDFILSNCRVPLRVKEHKNARRLTLRVDLARQEIYLITPPAVERSVIQWFIAKHRSWIEKRLARGGIINEDFHLKEGSRIPVLGASHVILRKEKRGVAEIITGDAGQESQIIIYSRLEHLPRRVADVLKKQAKIIIAPLVVHYASKVGRKVKSISYKDTRTRWGSCSTDGRLSFSWRLIMAPKEVVEYVVAHEVAHLVEMNHGERFWSLCEKLCPERKTYQAWLKKNGYTLQRINFH
ncbi:M48 family metallopeptidase [Bartonella sp. C271]|uniref:M48 family metallopeptidase n=1 Tax=Bartonella sp. C271 TaxID=3070220 RepID=UPI0038B5737A